MPLNPIRSNDGLLDKAEALAYATDSPRRPDQNKPVLRRVIRQYIEARRVDDDARAAELEQVLRRCVFGGESAVMAAASLGIELGGNTNETT